MHTYEVQLYNKAPLYNGGMPTFLKKGVATFDLLRQCIIYANCEALNRAACHYGGQVSHINKKGSMVILDNIAHELATFVQWKMVKQLLKGYTRQEKMNWEKATTRMRGNSRCLYGSSNVISS